MDAPWDPGLLCDIARAALEGEARRRDAAQEVAGLDALPELALHPLLLDGYRAAGLGAHAEVHYPARVGRKRSEGDRCDLVLTRAADEPLMDPAEAGTLFQTTGVPPGDAFWMEVKCVRQHAVIGGVGRPNAGYAGALAGPVAADVRRIAGEPAIRAGAVLLILFAADDATADHDLGAWAHRCLDRGLPIAAPSVRRFGVADRLGNGVCFVTLTPVRAGAGAVSGRSARAG